MTHQELDIHSQQSAVVGRGETGQSVRMAHLHFEHIVEAFGVGTARPRISWITETDITDWRQEGYEIEAYDESGQRYSQTGQVKSDQSVLIPWPFAPLRSRERVSLRVRVRGRDGQASDWSQPAWVEVGLLHAEDWSARFITPAWDEDITRSQPAPLLRREFAVREDMTRARLYVTALGVYEAQINGRVVGDHVLAPGWTSYASRLVYQTFDVSELLHVGQNTLGAILGDGWYRGRLGFEGGRRNIYGERLALLAQLEITYADGSIERIISDENWRAGTGPLLASDLYDGETYDARLELPGWSEPGYDDRPWTEVRLIEHDLGTLEAPSAPPVRRIEEIAPVAITHSPSGSLLVDFGQNLVGRLRLKVRGQAGATITLHHAEVLEHGELGRRPLRTALATDRYILRGEGDETWEPRFTFHGFRYAQVDGWPCELHADDLRAIVCHSDLERTGWFACSDPLLTRLHENVVWSMRGNFLSIPTDCPQRDERLGWTGDIQVFTPTAAFLYSTAGFLSSWLADVAAEQTAEGLVPFIVPNVMAELPRQLGGAMVPTAVWGDAAVLIPWELYQRYGDRGILETQFGSMCAWVDLLDRLTGERRLWESGFQFGDWLDPTAPPDRPAQTRTDPYVVATAYFAHSAEIVGEVAHVLGYVEKAAHYRELAEQVRTAFQREYITPAGRVLSDSATAYALAICFNLLQDPAQRLHAGERLAELMRKSGYHINTGFVGTPLICDALCQSGAYEAAFRLLTQRECPSWLYPVTMDATTIWERWDSMLPDGSINPGDMTSFNHYALGAVADWLHRVVAGLAPAEPGYRSLAIAPHPGGGLTWARATLHTPYGLAESAWEIKDGNLALTVAIPPNTTAGVTLPGKGEGPHVVGSGTHRWIYPYSPAQEQ